MQLLGQIIAVLFLGLLEIIILVFYGFGSLQQVNFLLLFMTITIVAIAKIPAQVLRVQEKNLLLQEEIIRLLYKDKQE